MNVVVDGVKYTVIENLGWNHGIGGYAKIVETPDGEQTAVRFPPGNWRFWTAKDRYVEGKP